MRKATTSHVKYIFLDIVGYTRNRSVEAQQDIIDILNNIVKECVKNSKVPEDKVIFLPTGDGICISLLVSESQYDIDIHLKIALDILKLIQEYNNETNDEMRRFLVRIGINSNVDNIIEDINGNKNVAGAGINNAQRVMNLADGNQVLVGQQVYETLRYRQKYLNSFREFSANVKHGQKLNVFQYIASDQPSLNTNIPYTFEENKKVEPKLSRIAAYYFAHAIINKNSFLKLQGMGKESHVIPIIIWFLAIDSVGKSEATETHPYEPITHGADQIDIIEQFEYYMTIDYWVCCNLCDFILKELSPHLDLKYFESGLSPGPIFVNERGKEKLKNECQYIWKEFDLEKYD